MVQMNWFAGQKERYRCREQTWTPRWESGGVGGGGGGGGGGMNWEIGSDMCTVMCIK